MFNGRISFDGTQPPKLCSWILFPYGPQVKKKFLDGGFRDKPLIGANLQTGAGGGIADA